MAPTSSGAQEGGAAGSTGLTRKRCSKLQRAWGGTGFLPYGGAPLPKGSEAGPLAGPAS